MRVPLCDLRPSIARDRTRLLDELAAVVDEAAFVLGPSVQRFEAALAAYLGRAHVVGVASCTDALELSLRALGVGARQAVVTTPFTFVATAEAIVHAGATPVFVDVDERDWLLDLDGVDRALTALPIDARGQRVLPSGEAVTALVAVHLFGAVASPTRLRALADRHHLTIVEDAAQALGGAAEGRRAGAIGETACFSFFPSKTLGGFGDGGAIATDDDALAARLRSLRQHGIRARSRGGATSDELGRNSRLDALQAAVLRVKLERLDDDVTERRRLVERYGHALSALRGHVQPLCASPPVGHAAQQMIVRAQRRDALADHLAAEGVTTAIYYPAPLHHMPPFAAAPRLTPLDHAEQAAREALALPLYVGLDDAAVAHVVASVTRFVDGARL